MSLKHLSYDQTFFRFVYHKLQFNDLFAIKNSQVPDVMLDAVLILASIADV